MTAAFPPAPWRDVWGKLKHKERNIIFVAVWGSCCWLGFATQNASLCLQVAGDIRKVYMVMSGIEGKLTAIPIKELRVCHQDQKMER